MGFEDGAKNRPEKSEKKSGKNQVCIFEVCRAVSGANSRVELCTAIM